MAQVPPFPPPPPPSSIPGGAGGRITERAGFWIRFLASLVDGLLLGAAEFAISVALLGEDMFERATNANGVTSVNYFFFRSTAGGLIAFAIASAYYIYFHGSPSGQTIGKKVTGIRVVGFEDGGPIGYGRSALRYIGTFLSRIPCGLGYLWMLWDSEKQTWHDKIASTVVVPESAAPVGKWPG